MLIEFLVLELPLLSGKSPVKLCCSPNAPLGPLHCRPTGLGRPLSAAAVRLWVAVCWFPKMSLEVFLCFLWFKIAEIAVGLLDS